MRIQSRYHQGVELRVHLLHLVVSTVPASMASLIHNRSNDIRDYGSKVMCRVSKNEEKETEANHLYSKITKY